MDRLVEFVMKILGNSTTESKMCLLFLGDMESTFLLDLLERRQPVILLLETKYFHKEVYDYMSFIKDKSYLEIQNIKCELSCEGLDSGKFLLKCIDEVVIPYMKKSRYDTLITTIKCKETKRKYKDITIISPLLDIPEPELWRYIEGKELPYCKIYDLGYTSIFNFEDKKSSNNDEEVLNRLKSLGYI